MQSKLHTLQITEWTSNLKARGYLGEKSFEFSYLGLGEEVSFVKYGKGKRSKYQIYDKKVSSHPENLKPQCKYFSECGGCRAQQIPYLTQFELKTQEIINYYNNTWNLMPKLLTAQDIWSYRNRMDFVVYPKKIGLHQEGNYNKIIDLEDCKIQSNRANLELQALRPLILNSNLPYNRKEKTGFLKYLTLRTNLEQTELQTILTFTEKFQTHPEKEIWKEKFLQTSLAEHLIFCYNREKAEVSAQGNAEVLKGNLSYTETILGKKFQVPFDAFFQPNPKGFLPILKFIDQEIQTCKEETLVDLFCGLGFFSLIFGDYFKKIIGYDITHRAIEKANFLLKENFPQKEISFEVKDLYALKEEFFLKQEIFCNSLFIVDPPRNGLGKKLIKTFKESLVKKIIYVSCNPYSQINDLEELKEIYFPKSIFVTDPYPHTPHLESVLILEKKDEIS